MKYILVVLMFAVIGCASKGPKPKSAKVKPLFETTDGILHPESAFYSAKHKAIFVSNITNGNPMEKNKVSFLSKLTPEGKMDKLKWVEGLKAPKGIAVVGDFLFVSDVDQVVKVDINAAKIVKTFPIPHAKFLNDVVADAEGNIYVSDMKDDVIYKIKGNKLSIWLKDTKIYGTNGLFVAGNEHIIAARWGSDIDANTFVAKIPGNLAYISLKDPKKIEIVNSIHGHLDGIDTDAKGNLWISDWMNGSVYSMTKSGTAELEYNFGQGTADLSVAKDLNLLLIPQMYQNKVIGIQLK